MGGAITNVRGKEFVKYVAGIALPSVVTVLLISVVAHPEIHVHADFYAAIAQIIPVLLLADFLLFARTRRLLATAVKRRSEIARLREENRKLSAKAADRQSEYEMLVAKFEELRLEAVRLGSPIPARPEPMDDVADDGHESDDSAGFDLDKLAGAIDGAITATLAWAVAAEGGALVALASDTSSILTLQLAVLGTAWLTIVLAITEIMSESVSTSEDATGEVF